VKRDGTPTKSISGKQLIAGLLLSIIVVAGLLFWAGMTGGSTHVPLSKAGVGFIKDEAGPPPGTSSSTGDGAAAAAAWDGGAIAATIHDRRVRDELRQRILAGWAAEGEPEVAAAAKQGRFVPAPAGPDGGRMDPKYIQEVIRGEFFPMAKKCYEELLSRKKTAAGRIEMSFSIVADEKLGAIIEDVEADHGDSGIADEKMTTCMRESLSTVSFRPPAHGGLVTVVYPILFSPDDDHDGG
jgi:hypothetical protein